MISPTNREVDIGQTLAADEYIGMVRREVMDGFMRDRAIEKVHKLCTEGRTRIFLLQHKQKGAETLCKSRRSSVTSGTNSANLRHSLVGPQRVPTTFRFAIRARTLSTGW